MLLTNLKAIRRSILNSSLLNSRLGTTVRYRLSISSSLSSIKAASMSGRLLEERSAPIRSSEEGIARSEPSPSRSGASKSIAYLSRTLSSSGKASRLA